MTTTARSLCPECSECPEIVIGDDGTVSIGEDQEWITLEPRQWKELVRLIRAGEIGDEIG